MSEVVRTFESNIEPVTAAGVGAVATERLASFEPGVAEPAGNIVDVTLGHSGNGGDSTAGYYKPMAQPGEQVIFQ